MKSHRTLILAAVMLVAASLLIAGAVQPAHAQSAATLAGKSLYNVNIRSGPGLGRAVIGLLPSGSEFVAIGRTSDNNWVQVEYQETTGWSAAWLLVFTGDTSRLPVTTDIVPPLASGPGPFTLYSPYNVNLRAEPSLTGEVLKRVPFVSQMRASARDESGSWIKVTYLGQEGWVAAWLTILDGDIAALPVADEVATPQPTATPTPVPTDTPPDEAPPDEAPPDEAPPESSEAPSGGITVVGPGSTNIRAEPDLKAQVVAVLPFGRQAQAIGRNASNNWIQVTYEGNTGWVAAWVVALSTTHLALPVTSEIDVTVPHSGDISGQAAFTATIRSLPGLEYAPLGQMVEGDTAALLARTAQNDWVKVNFNGIEGWVAAWLISADADLNNLPAETPGG